MTLLAAIETMPVWLAPPVPTVNCRMPFVGSDAPVGVCGLNRS
jgi:hypothetical protein